LTVSNRDSAVIRTVENLTVQQILHSNLNFLINIAPTYVINYHQISCHLVLTLKKEK